MFLFLLSPVATVICSFTDFCCPLVVMSAIQDILLQLHLHELTVHMIVGFYNYFCDFFFIFLASPLDDG